MNIAKRSGVTGTLVALAAATLLGSSATAFADTALTVNGVDIDDSVLNMYVESRLQRPAAQATPEELSVITQELTDIYLLTTQDSANALANDATVKAQIELQSRAVLAQAVAVDYFANNPATEEEILAAYQEQMAAAPALQFKARHILVDPQSKAVELITQLEEGADFAELAKEHSTGPTGPNGGDLGWFAPNQMVKEFSDAVVALENGEFTKEPVQTQFG
ncbi:MAG: peptidylprolyl isomerase, partial [Woeseiaceae bacterium]